MLTHTVATTIRSAAGGTVVTVSTVFEADAEFEINNQVDAGDTLIESVDLDPDDIESWFIYSDKAVTVTPYDGLSATVDGPFAVPAKKAIAWDTGDPTSNPLTAPFTSLHIANPGEDAANIKGGFLFHAAS